VTAGSADEQQDGKLVAGLVDRLETTCPDHEISVSLAPPFCAEKLSKSGRFGQIPPMSFW